ncbi:NAD-dependent epimerase/dehydratase [Nitritalea halalkaliphila LW7]|uniref:NAD-dependent epimerase/dehydratase n=1 Tax=Nitritalea halalkaliphila LW7 TaxID=1189621 RepID=I5C5R4_9BACT|nr:NAD-dependent epimerase/dehydratase family protein [Nitritalea halalkaliphila]EIM77166.1 NAD-dependent epimerase/dehydratase [Nitritalea halalkaliphila LW7]
MNLLVIGATGLVGRHLLRTLQGTCTLFALKRPQTPIPAGYEKLATWVEGDLLDSFSLEKALENMELVLNASGKVSFSAQDAPLLEEVNIRGVEILVNSLLAMEKPAKLIHISSVAALGVSPGQDSIDETQKWDHTQPHTAYADSKYRGEVEVWRGGQEGLDVLVLNPSLILAPFGEPGPSQEIYELPLKSPTYYPTGSVNIIDIRDLCAIIAYFIAEPQWGERFILNGGHYPYKDFLAALARKRQVPAPKKPLKGLPLQAALATAKILRLFPFIRLSWDENTLKSAKRSVWMKNDKLKKTYPHPLRTLEETLNWAFANDSVGKNV